MKPDHFIIALNNLKNYIHMEITFMFLLALQPNYTIFPLMELLLETILSQGNWEFKILVFF